jgi:tetratricopeptide (TPR) repeat protein
MPVLYRQLFVGNSLATALCWGRQELLHHKVRRAYLNQKIDLEDWVLPIVYQNRDVPFELQPMTPKEETAFYQKAAELYKAPQPGYGFIGRDLDILHIEKRLLMKRNLLLIRGMGGAGKTTLLRHLAEWWQRTGLVQQVFYFGYDERAWSRQQLMRTIAQKLLGKEDFALFQSRSQEAQQVQLTQLLRSASHLIILDNLESILGTHLAIRHTLSKKEQGFLRNFLTELVGGQTLVLLGSRSTEDWLAKETFADNRYDFGGLDPAAASILTERILERHHATKYRQDKDLPTLIKLLDGFPLALEVVLANLAHQTPSQVLAALQAGSVTLQTGESDTRTENILRCIDYSHSNLSPEAQQLLLCLALFTSVIFRDLLEQYATQLKKQPALQHLPFDRWSEVVQEAECWGLLSPDSDLPSFLHLQPVLPYFLRNRISGEEHQPQRVAIETAFREHYQELSLAIKFLIDSKQANERQTGLLMAQFEYENLVTALRLALQEKVSVITLYEVLSKYLDHNQDHQHGQEIDGLVVDMLEKLFDEQLVGPLGKEFAQVLVSAANRQVQLKQYRTATELYQKTLQMLETVSLEKRQRHLWEAETYHNLGVVAQEQREWEEAKRNYEEALRILTYLPHIFVNHPLCSELVLSAGMCSAKRMGFPKGSPTKNGFDAMPVVTSCIHTHYFLSCLKQTPVKPGSER